MYSCRMSIVRCSGRHGGGGLPRGWGGVCPGGVCLGGLIVQGVCLSGCLPRGVPRRGVHLTNLWNIVTDRKNITFPQLRLWMVRMIHCIGKRLCSSRPFIKKISEFSECSRSPKHELASI